MNRTQDTTQNEVLSGVIIIVVLGVGWF